MAYLRVVILIVKTPKAIYHGYFCENKDFFKISGDLKIPAGDHISNYGRQAGDHNFFLKSSPEKVKNIDDVP